MSPSTRPDYEKLQPGERKRIHDAMVDAGFDPDGELTHYGGQTWINRDYAHAYVRVDVSAQRDLPWNAHHSLTCSIRASEYDVRSKTYKYGKNGFNVDGIVESCLDKIAKASEIAIQKRHDRSIRDTTDESIQKSAGDAGVAIGTLRASDGKARMDLFVPLDRLTHVLVFLKEQGIIEAEALGGDSALDG